MFRTLLFDNLWVTNCIIVYFCKKNNHLSGRPCSQPACTHAAWWWSTPSSPPRQWGWPAHPSTSPSAPRGTPPTARPSTSPAARSCTPASARPSTSPSARPSTSRTCRTPSQGWWCTASPPRSRRPVRKKSRIFGPRTRRRPSPRWWSTAGRTVSVRVTGTWICLHSVVGSSQHFSSCMSLHTGDGWMKPAWVRPVRLRASMKVSCMVKEGGVCCWVFVGCEVSDDNVLAMLSFYIWDGGGGGGGGCLGMGHVASVNAVCCLRGQMLTGTVTGDVHV